MRPRHGELSAVLSPRCPVILLVVNYMRDAIMPGVWARTSLIHNKRPRPPGISVKCTFVVSPRGNARKRAGQAQHAYPWPRDGLVPRVRSSMERVRAGEGDPDRAGGTPATPRSRAPVPKTARTNARSPHLTYAPVRKTRTSSPASSPFLASARAAREHRRGGAPRRGGLTGASWAPARASPRRRRSCGSGPPSTAYRDDDIEWKRVRCGRAPSRLQLSGRSSCSSSS